MDVPQRGAPAVLDTPRGAGTREGDSRMQAESSTKRRRRELTPAQQTASDGRRAMFRDFARKVAALSEAEREALTARIGAVTIEGHALSVHNACLAYMQRPGCTVLGGFNQWRAAGRMVRKGEHGLMVWAPTKSRRDAEADDDRPGFVPVTLFDITQTDAVS